MKSLNEDLKTGNFKQIYLLYGEEAYLKKQYKDRFIKAMLPDGDTMNLSYYEGKNTDFREVIDLAETLPFFSQRRLIVFEDTGFFKNSGAELADYISEMPDFTYFLFIESEVDKRSRLYKAVKAKGHIVELTTQDENTLRRWVQGLVRQEKKQIEPSDIAYFINKVGTDMENIVKELEKLICYAIDRDVLTRDDIDAVCVTQISSHIFEMIRAVTDKNQRKALDLYYELLALKEPPMRILYLMTREYRIMYHVKVMEKEGRSGKDIASKAGIPPFAAGKYLDQVKKYKTGELRKILEESAETEQKVKTGLLTDQLAVELFIVRQSGNININIS